MKPLIIEKSATDTHLDLRKSVIEKKTEEIMMILGSHNVRMRRSCEIEIPTRIAHAMAVVEEGVDEVLAGSDKDDAAIAMARARPGVKMVAT